MPTFISTIAYWFYGNKKQQQQAIDYLMFFRASQTIGFWNDCLTHLVDIFLDISKIIYRSIYYFLFETSNSNSCILFIFTKQ
jgi:hypothetical protein